MSSVEVVQVAEALEVVAQLVQLVQQAQAAGVTTIPKAQFDAVVVDRNAALVQLDADIAAKT